MFKNSLTLAAATGLCLAAFSNQASAHDEPVIGTLAGAGIGAAVAGPPGAAVGAVIGAIIGATEAHESDHGANGHHHRHYGRARIAPVRYYSNGNGSTKVYCEPARGYYRPTVVHVDDRARVVRTRTVTKTKMKKVCRYEPIKTTTRVVVASR
jgi:hypothetical protein